MRSTASEQTRAIRSAGRVLIDARTIANRVGEIGATIARDYQGKTLDVVVVLEGARVFWKNLARTVADQLDLRVHYMRASSYGQESTPTRPVRLTQERGISLRGRDVLLVDDIVDTGRTARALLQHVWHSGARSSRLAAFLSKPDRRSVPVPIDYLGFEIPDEFVVGYGMDYAGEYRELPDVQVLEGPH